MRLDSMLYTMGYFQSRQKAKESILAHKVRYAGILLTKPSTILTKYQNQYFLHDKPFAPHLLHIESPLVSRAGEKLKAFLQTMPLPLKDSIILDVGSSTGGFAQVLLQYGAKHIVCVDVGSAQLHQSLRQDSRIELFEQCDIREFYTTQSFDYITCDVSFISLRLILPALLRFDSPALLLLFKPQFEVGKEAKRNKKGVLQEQKAIIQSLESFGTLLSKTHTFSIHKSSILGKEGNAEYFILAYAK